MVSKVGVPKEILDNEYRVALTQGGVQTLFAQGHTVYVQKNAGIGSGISDKEYIQAGAKIVPDADSLFENAELILKVKEPQESEIQLLNKKHLLFTYLHLAAKPKLAIELAKTGATCIGYETVQTDSGSLPLLTPMSEIAGRMAPQIGASYLEKPHGGRGVLLGGVPGVEPGEVIIIGGGTVGVNAAKIALGMEARVTIFDRSLERLHYLDDLFNGRAKTVYSTNHDVEAMIPKADLVIGAVLLPGKQAPHIVTAETVKKMKPGSVIIDVSVDQGGCIETVHTTTHSDPTYLFADVIHYGVANMPGAVPWTSTHALTNATLPYILKLAHFGYDAVLEDRTLERGVNIHNGRVVHPGVIESVRHFSKADLIAKIKQR
jgi:alanine dehydrogenase